LQGIRKLLLREYKKYFQKQFYKMETPFIGKRADVLNKQAVVAFFHNKKEEARKLWEDALKQTERHLDAQTNLSIYKWSLGEISDQELMYELEEVFENQNKGKTLNAYLLLAQGQRESGVQMLKEYTERLSKELGVENKRIKIETKHLNAKKLEYLK
jgi:hypothetical protein